MSAVAQRVVAVLILGVAGLFSLPVAAFVLDGPRTENWILPAQLLVMALLGAGVALTLPTVGRSGWSGPQRAAAGAAWGLLAAVVGVAVFWLALNGLRGA